ncbi:N-formylglutamate amidohydrolase [Pedobacter sp. MC2016-14]|uniref:N-formylglutamate amidohydrolase n=1 Tax=Pedobacter sp. MC2016-14 TaxID=2897327 RepID=UPI001E29CFE2|nr:N-formylglutamate amidohydrolase [Pedobacter sp. MC2016-14]MCD0488582.1 N-formylglutamate amidohydrolase [Pedobacter sp. MC2016-14]
MKLLKLTPLLLLFFVQAAFAQKWESGKSYFDEEHWTEFIPGDMPLVISIPHGGTLVLPEVPLRDCKGAVTVTDTHTAELGREIQNTFFKKYGKRPYLIISLISRKNVDQNRDLEEGTCGNQLMIKPWHAFHDNIDTALALAVKQFGSTLYIDLHGHGHTNQRLELGYSLNASELPDVSNKTDLKELAQKSTLNNLLTINKKADFKDLMIGDHAFGTLITEAGSPAVPSKQDPFIADGGKYFNGGYNTRTYTSAKYPKVFGWQIESNYKGVRDAAGRPAFAKAFADVIMKYFKENTTIKL